MGAQLVPLRTLPHPGEPVPCIGPRARTTRSWALRHLLWLVLVLALGLARFASSALAEDGTSGGHSRQGFHQQQVCEVNSQPVTLVLTGAARYRKFCLNIYSVGSYVEQGFQFQSPEQLAAADVPKRLCLVAERPLSGQLIAAAIEKEIRDKSKVAALPAEVDDLLDSIEQQRFQAGDEIQLTYLPGVGVRGEIAGRVMVMVHNPEIAAAIWDSYLGPNCFSSQIKTQLASRPSNPTAATR